jgi:hypothetical protein
VEAPDRLDFDPQHVLSLTSSADFMMSHSYSYLPLGRRYHIARPHFPPSLVYQIRRKYDVDCI